MNTYSLGSRAPDAAQQSAILGFLDASGGQAAPGKLAGHLGLTLAGLRPQLDHLQGQGLIRQVQVGVRRLYERTHLEPDLKLVRNTYRPRIRAYLQGRACMPPTIARTLDLPEDEVRETCKAMLRDGELTATPVGATFVYRLNLPARNLLPDAS